MIAALFVLGLMIDRCPFTALDLHFTGREVTLEVLSVRSRIPQAPFRIRKKLEMFDLVGEVGDRYTLDLGLYAQRYKMQYRRTHTVLLSCDAGVVQTMPALVFVQRCLARFPSRIPDSGTIYEVEIATYRIHRYAVITITGDAAEFRVFVEIITTSRIGDQAEEILVSKVVDPRERCLRIGDDVLPFGVIKMSVLFAHKYNHSKYAAKLLLFCKLH